MSAQKGEGSESLAPPHRRSQSAGRPSGSGPMHRRYHVALALQVLPEPWPHSLPYRHGRHRAGVQPRHWRNQALRATCLRPPSDPKRQSPRREYRQKASCFIILIVLRPALSGCRARSMPQGPLEDAPQTQITVEDPPMGLQCEPIRHARDIIANQPRKRGVILRCAHFGLPLAGQLVRVGHHMRE